MKPVLLLALALAASAAQAQVTYSGTNDASFTLINGEKLCQDYCAATSVPDPANPNRLLIGFGVGLQGSCLVGGGSFPCWTDQAFHVGTQTFIARQRVDSLCTTATAAEGQYISKVAVTQRGSFFTARGGHATGLATVSIDNVQIFAGSAFAVSAVREALQADVDARIFHTKVDICISTSLSATSSDLINGRKTNNGIADARVSETDFLVETSPIPPVPAPEAIPAQ